MKHRRVESESGKIGQAMVIEVIIHDNIANSRKTLSLRQPVFMIGRGQECQVRLDSRFVSAQHVRVTAVDGGFEVEVMESAANGATVDDVEVRPGRKIVMDDACRIGLATYLLELRYPAAARRDVADIQAFHAVQQSLHAAVLQRLDLRLEHFAEASQREMRSGELNDLIDTLIQGSFRSRVLESDLSGLLVRMGLIHRVRRQLAAAADEPNSSFKSNPGLEREIQTLVRRIVSAMGKRPEEVEQLEPWIENRFDDAMRSIAGGLLHNVRVYIISSYLKKLLYDVIFGLGPLEDLIHDTEVSEIMVVHPWLIYIERAGRITRSSQVFPSSEAAVAVIERIVAPLGRRIDRAQPLVDARLRDGSRVNAVIEPLAVKGPCITIRKFPRNHVSVTDLIQWQSLSAPAAELLRSCVLHRANIIVAGGTGSGKTTLLNALSSMIPAYERLVTVEDSAELRLQQEHVVTLETRPPGAEGTGAYTVRDLVKNALRMRPDRIIVGECRGEESLDMLQAMNTGHAGSMTTLHANSSEDVAARLETMVLSGAAMPLASVRRQISQAIDLIVFIARLADGSRRVMQISELTGLHPVSGEIETRDIMRCVPTPEGLRMKPTGYMPSFLGQMVERGHLDLGRWFATVTGGAADSKGEASPGPAEAFKHEGATG